MRVNTFYLYTVLIDKTLLSRAKYLQYSFIAQVISTSPFFLIILFIFCRLSILLLKSFLCFLVNEQHFELLVLLRNCTEINLNFPPHSISNSVELTDLLGCTQSAKSNCFPLSNFFPIPHRVNAGRCLRAQMGGINLFAIATGRFVLFYLLWTPPIW